MNWIDEPPYPWSKAIAQQLHRSIVKVKPTVQMATYIANVSGIDTTFINLNNPVFFLWKDILEHASSSGLLRNMLTVLFNESTGNQPLHHLLKEILDTGKGPVEAEQLDLEGKPVFLQDDDTITEQEALLFREDLTLPIGRLRALITSLEKLEQLAPAVCRLIVSIDVQIQYGTAFRIGWKTLLTNHHVLHARHTDQHATAVTANFNYEDDGAGGYNTGTAFKCDVSSIRADKESDWGVIDTVEELPVTIPIIRISDGVPAELNDLAFIIQHPLSGAKRLGYVRNTVSNVTPVVAHYLTDTQDGSSGSPVFNGDGKLIAVHRAGGLPVEIMGKQPMKKNEGVLAVKIKSDFLEKGIEVV